MKAIRLFLAAVTVGIFCYVPLASADVNNFVITNFTADETLSNQDKQGTLRIVEHISVNFTDNNHGILRAIPNSYKGLPSDLNINGITSESGAPTSYTTYTSNGNEVMKIGDANRTVTGPQEYTIDYTLHNVIGFYKDHDELYWDVNGNQWQQPVDNVTVTVHLPSAATLSNNQPICYAGSYRSKDQGCTITHMGNLVTASAKGLQGYQTLTYVVGFQKGFFQPESLWDKAVRYGVPIAEFMALPVIVGIVGFRLWYKNGRDAKGRGTIVPEYSPPVGLTPIEAGTITDFKIDNRDMTATIIDLAIRGYVKIIETKETHVLRKDKLSYTLQLQNADTTSLKPYELALLKALFAPYDVGSTTTLDSQKNKLSVTAALIRGMVEAQLTSDGYFKANPLKSSLGLKSVLGVLFLGLFILGHLLLNIFVISLVAAVAIGLFFMSIMAARTAKGVAAKEQMEGLKMYLQTAEADRIKMLQSPGAPYADNAGAPEKTVQLFEKLLPYAIILGVENEWSKQFEGIYNQAPEWYGGNFTAFNAGYMTGNLSSGFATSFNTAFAAPGSSSGSGFGGGAGGGGGGGGGGGW